MSVCEMNVCEMSVCEMSVCEMRRRRRKEEDAEEEAAGAELKTKTPHKDVGNKFTSCKFHVSQTNCFTFPNNKTPTLCKFRKFMQTSLCKTQQSLSSLASSQTILSDLTGLKTHLPELSHRISL